MKYGRTFTRLVLLAACWGDSAMAGADQSDPASEQQQADTAAQEYFDSLGHNFYIFRKLSRWWNEVDYRGSKVSAVDMHLHTGLWDDLPESFQETLLETIPFPFNFPLLAEPFVNILLSAYGIGAQLVCSRIRICT